MSAHIRAAANIVQHILVTKPILRHGQPLRLVKHGRGKYSLENDRGAPLGAPARQDLEMIISWLEEVRR
jgi:hypothetical protein